MYSTKQIKRKTKLKKTIYTVCNGEQSIVGIELDVRNDAHSVEDNVGDIGDDVA